MCDNQLNISTVKLFKSNRPFHRTCWNAASPLHASDDHASGEIKRVYAETYTHTIGWWIWTKFVGPTRCFTWQMNLMSLKQKISLVLFDNTHTKLQISRMKFDLRTNLKLTNFVSNKTKMFSLFHFFNCRWDFLCVDPVVWYVKLNSYNSKEKLFSPPHLMCVYIISFFIVTIIGS